MENYDDGGIINVGSGFETSIQELSETIKAIVGFEGKIIWDQSKPDGTPRKLLDHSRIFAMGWRPEVSLEQGIRRAYQDFLSQQPEDISTTAALAKKTGRLVATNCDGSPY